MAHGTALATMERHRAPEAKVMPLRVAGPSAVATRDPGEKAWTYWLELRLDAQEKHALVAFLRQL